MIMKQDDAIDPGTKGKMVVRLPYNLLSMIHHKTKLAD